ncbi:unnamed protein product, partial [Lymnaea stagnalis]
ICLCFKVLHSELSHPPTMTSEVHHLDNSMRPVLAPQRTACKKTFLTGRRFRSSDRNTDNQRRLPWDASPVQSRDKNMKPRKHCKELTLEIDQPDFICFPCTRILRLGNGRSVTAGESLLCKQNFKTAPWACGQRHQIHVKQCELWGVGSSRIKHDILPNNYRIINADILSPPVPQSPLEAHCRSLLQNK